MLNVERISKSVGALALKDISFDVRAGSYLVLLGASGAGKSVLLETIAGLAQPDCGRILLDDKEITNERMQNRRVGLVFQDSALFPHLSVYGNIAYPLRCKRVKASLIKARVAELARDVGVAHLLKRRPTTLSGGEAQRVSLARVLAGKPRCLLLDEPLSSLDAKARTEMRALLRKIHRRGSQAIVHVTHDYTEAVALGTHVAVLEHGTIVQTGTAAEIFQRPKSEFVAQFAGIKNFFKGELHAPDDGGAKTGRFRADGLDFCVVPGSASTTGNGFVCIRSEDVTISNGALSGLDAATRRIHTSARNNFEGAIVDIIPAGRGVEVIIDIGRSKPVELAALVTVESVESLGLYCGKIVRAGFKASAVQYIEQ